MEKVRPWRGRPWNRGRLKNRTLVCTAAAAAAAAAVVVDRYFINHNRKNNNCKLKQYSERLPEGILHQSWSPEHVRVIFITITSREKTDKQTKSSSSSSSSSSS